MPRSANSILKECIKDLGDEFKPDALAYLSLTSKNERLLCGALAQRLHRQYDCEGSDFLVRREWTCPDMPRRPVDIAVLRGGDEPHVLIEAKAAMAFDPLVNGSRIYPSADVAKDVEKLRKLKKARGRYVLAFFTRWDKCPDPRHSAAMPYFGGMKRRPDGMTDGERDAALQRFRASVLDRTDCGLRAVEHGEFPAGCAFGVNVSVFYQLMSLPTGIG